MTHREAMRAADRQYWQALFDRNINVVEMSRISGKHRDSVHKHLKALGINRGKVTRHGNRGNEQWQALA